METGNLTKSGGNFIVKLWPKAYRHGNGRERKGRTEKLVKVGVNSLFM